MQSANEDTVVLTDATSQPYQHMIFVNNCNQYLGSEIVQTLRNDHIVEVNPNILIGSCNPNDESSPPEGVEIISYNNKKSYNTVIKRADIIIFSLDFSNLQQFEYILRILKYMEVESPKTIICVSNLLSWNETPHKTIKSADLQARSTRFTYLSTLQNMCLNIDKENQKIHGYVVNTGVVYGLGEGPLLPYFKQAILQSPEQLSVLGDGKNFLPMIHVKDLCNFIETIALTRPHKKYFLVCDDSIITQYELLKTITESLGNGKLNLVSLDEAIWRIDFDLLVDFKIERDQAETLKNWHCRQGFIKNITKVVSEFNLYRGIQANKIFIAGIPVAGKSYTATTLAKHYNLPLLRIKDTIQFAKHKAGDFGQQIVRTLDHIKAKLVQQEQKIFDEAKKKKKAKKGQPVEQFNPDKIIPRLPDAFVTRIFEWRLSQPDCRNKGYVLEGWPKSYEQCVQLFSKGDKQRLPNSYIWMEATEEEVKDRVKKLPSQVTLGTHWTQDATNRRLLHFKKLQQGKHINQYFKQKHIGTKSFPFDWSSKKELINFIERNGPIGFTPPEPLVIPSSPKIETQVKTQVEIKQNVQQEEHGFNFELLKADEKKLLDEKSKPIRQYLIDNVIPHLTEGLIEVCRKVPKEPLDFLIEFLEKKMSS